MIMKRVMVLSGFVAAACASPPPPPLPDVVPEQVVRVDLGAPVTSVPASGGMTATFRPRAGTRFEAVDPSRVRVANDGRTIVGVRWGLSPVRVVSSEEVDSVWVLVRPSGRFEYGGALDYVAEPLPRGAFVTEEPIASVSGFAEFEDVEGGVRVRTDRCRRVISMKAIHRGEGTPCGILFSGDELHIVVRGGGQLRYEYPVRTNRCVQRDAQGICVEWDTTFREGIQWVEMRGVLRLVRR